MSNSQAGHINWTTWDFDWAVSGAEGLSLLNLSYKGVWMLGKGSLPVIRVKYVKDEHWYDPFHWAGGCGPYADQLQWEYSWWDEHVRKHKLVRISNCKNELVCIREFRAGRREALTAGDIRWLELGIYARIGAYHIFQAWYLSETGTMLPRVWSKGLSCNTDHTHHPYWRLDFDIDGPSNNRLDYYTYQGFHYYLKECNDVKRGERFWLVRNRKGWGRSVLIFPSPEDGHANAWSGLDIALRRYHLSEEFNPWPFGTGEIGFLDGETVDGEDLVVWYVSHMPHHASEGGDAWHHTGPTLVFQHYD